MELACEWWVRMKVLQMLAACVWRKVCRWCEVRERG